MFVTWCTVCTEPWAGLSPLFGCTQHRVHMAALPAWELPLASQCGAGCWMGACLCSPTGAASRGESSGISHGLTCAQLVLRQLFPALPALRGKGLLWNHPQGHGKEQLRVVPSPGLLPVLPPVHTLMVSHQHLPSCPQPTNLIFHQIWVIVSQTPDFPLSKMEPEQRLSQDLIFSYLLTCC